MIPGCCSLCSLLQLWPFFFPGSGSAAVWCLLCDLSAVPLRYVTPGAFIEAAEEFGIPREVAVRNWDGCIQARAALFLPGGRIARELARNPTVLVVNDTAFAHGGLLPTHGELT